MGCSNSHEGSGSAASVSDGDAAASEPSATLQEVEALITLGAETYGRGEYDSTRMILSPALERAIAAYDSSAEARILTTLGKTAYREGDLAAARALGEHSLDLKIASGLDEELWSSYNLLGLVALLESRLSDATDLFDKAAVAAVDRTSADVRAVIAINRGLIFTDLGRFTQARTAFEAGRDLSRSLPQSTRRDRLEGVALNNLGMLYVWIGDPAAAIPVLQQAMPLYRAAGFLDGQFNALAQLGTAYTAMGQVGNAIATLDSAVDLSRERGLQWDEAQNLQALAEAYRAAGDHRRALDLYEQAEVINGEIGAVSDAGIEQRSRAEIYASLGDLRLARSVGEMALATHRAAEARWEELADLVLLADVTQDAGDDVASRDYLRAARRLVSTMDARTARIDVALAEARIAQRNGNPGDVVRILDAARQDLTDVGYDVEAEVATLRARALYTLGALDPAIAAGRRAVTAVEHIRSGINSGVLRTAYTSDRLDAYATLASILVESGNAAAAFEVADAAHGRALLENLAVGRSREAIPEGPVAGLQRGEELLRRINELRLRLLEIDELDRDERDSGVTRDFQAQLLEARNEYEAIHVATIERDRTRSALLGKHTISASEIQASLLDRELLLEYLVTRERLLGFAMTSDDVWSFEYAITEEDLSRRVRIARDLLDHRGTDEAARNAVLGGLYRVLLGRLDSLPVSGFDRLVIVPHGALNYLPFAALHDATTGRHLVEDYVIQVVPSASALPVLRRRARETTVEEESSQEGIVFAPLTDVLPTTRDEVRTFRRAIANSKSVEGRRATEARVRSALEHPQIVHIASHGVMNARNPMFSRIELNPGGDDRSVDDGRLEVHELLALSIKSTLIFLSGCETALGPSWTTSFSRGEDYVTMAQAFLYGGASNVVATLWRIEDEGAAVFTEEFYGALGEGDPAEALATAQRAMMRHPRYSAPFYWAAYQVAGEGLTTFARRK